MGRPWRVALVVSGVVISAVLSVSCTPFVKNDGEPRANQEKLKVDYDAKKTDQKDRLKIKKDNSGATMEYGRCNTEVNPRCRNDGFPVKSDGTELLGPLTAPLDQVWFLSDVTNPGRSCVCYGNRCYCN